MVTFVSEVHPAKALAPIVSRTGETRRAPVSPEQPLNVSTPRDLMFGRSTTPVIPDLFLYAPCPVVTTDRGTKFVAGPLNSAVFGSNALCSTVVMLHSSIPGNAVILKFDPSANHCPMNENLCGRAILSM